MNQVHAHWTMLPTLKASRKTLIDTNIGIAWLLDANLSEDEASKVLQTAAAG